jgi:hypothetical protein
MVVTVSPCWNAVVYGVSDRLLSAIDMVVRPVAAHGSYSSWSRRRVR